METEVSGTAGGRTDWARIWLNLLTLVVVLLALAVAAGSFIASRFSVLAPPQGPREWFIDDQRAAVSVWALVTAASAVTIRLRPRLAPLVAGGWSLALAMAAPWGWPDDPATPGAPYEVTVWRDGWRSLGALVLLSVAFGCTIGWRGDRRDRIFAATMAALVLIVFAVSASVVLLAQAEERTTESGQVAPSGSWSMAFGEAADEARDPSLASSAVLGLSVAGRSVSRRRRAPARPRPSPSGPR